MKRYKALILKVLFIILVLASLVSVSSNESEVLEAAFPATDNELRVVNLYYQNNEGKTVLLPYQTARDLFIREKNENMWEQTRIVVATQREEWLIVEMSDGTFLNYTAVYLDKYTDWHDVRKNPSAYEKFHVAKPVASLIINEDGAPLPLVELVSVGEIKGIYVDHGTPAEVAISKLQEDVAGTLNDEAATAVKLFIDWEKDKAYDPEQPGDYTFLGSLSTLEAFIIPPELRTVRAKVTVGPQDETERPQDETERPQDETDPAPETGSLALQIRIENWKHTTVPLRQITVAPFDITPVVGDNAVGNWHRDNDEPLAIHAIIKALEVEGFNVQDKNVISVGSQGNYISKIDGLAEAEKGGISGWKYRVNGRSVDLGVGQQTLKNGDLVEVYYRAGGSYHFGRIEASSKQLPAGGTVTVTVTGEPESFGAPKPYEPIPGATITLNGQTTGSVTDQYGKTEIILDKPGSYSISAEKIEGNDYNLIRPVPVTIAVTDKEVRKTTQNIAAVSDVKDIKVKYGTGYRDIGFPETAWVTLEDGTSRRVGVNWASAAEAGYDPGVAGLYRFEGRLVNLPANVTNTDHLKAEVVVEVEELKHDLAFEVESIEVEYEPDLLGETIVHVYIKEGYEVGKVTVNTKNREAGAVKVEDNKYYLAFFETDLTGIMLKVSVESAPTTRDPGQNEGLDLSGVTGAAVSWYLHNHNPPDSWEGMPGLWGLGENLNTAPWSSAQDWRHETYQHGTQRHWHVHYIFKLLSVGKDPTSVWGGMNLFKELADLQENNGSFAGYTDAAHPWPVVALDVGKELGLNVGSWNAVNREKAVEYLLSKQNSDGSFSIDLDTTGYYLIALSKYMDNPEVKKAVDHAVDYLKRMQDEEAFFDEGKGRNANSQAIVISGLVAVGADPLKGTWVRNGHTPLDALLKFQQSNGQFYWKKNEAGSGTMGHDDALVALSCLLNGESTWHRLGKQIIPGN